MRLISDSIDELYVQALAAILDKGIDIAPRSRRTLELLAPQLVLTQPEMNIVTSPQRKLNYHFSVAEWLWIMLGYQDGKTILPYNRNLTPYINEQGNFDGAYGPRWVQQRDYLLSILKADPGTRQAVATIWTPNPRQSPDVPCTVSLQFLLRKEGLHCVATMRSNDAWLGLPYDVFNFTQLQRYLAMELDAPVGYYIHQPASLHLYEPHFQAADRLVDKPATMPIASPPLSRMPDAFRAFHLGITLMGEGMQLYGQFQDQLVSNASVLPEPWRMYLLLLGSRFTKNYDYIGEPYNRFLTGGAPQ